MNQAIYTLFFRDIEIGTIRFKDSDFPNCWGSFEESLGTDHPEIRQYIGQYMAHSHESDRLMLLDDSPGGAWDEFMREHDGDYLDLIECDDWRLVDATGVVHPILVPFFTADGVTWRLDPTR